MVGILFFNFASSEPLSTENILTDGWCILLIVKPEHLKSVHKVFIRAVFTDHADKVMTSYNSNWFTRLLLYASGSIEVMFQIIDLIQKWTGDHTVLNHIYENMTQITYIAGYQFLDLYTTYQILSSSIMTSYFVWN